MPTRDVGLPRRDDYQASGQMSYTASSAQQGVTEDLATTFNMKQLYPCYHLNLFRRPVSRTACTSGFIYRYISTSIMADGTSVYFRRCHDGRHLYSVVSSHDSSTEAT